MSHSHNSSDESLAGRLRERIRREGAITFRDWMAAALYDEREGYYCRRDLKRWGRAGDYRTTPERSPLFAATFADHFVKLYQELGAPAAWTILEAGAGAGHFAEGVLRTLRRDYPEVFNATHYVIDEPSADGRERVSARLSEYSERLEFRAFAEICAPVSAGVVFANELLDSFPVHRVMSKGGRLRELFVGLDGDGEFIWTEDESSTERLRLYLERAGVRLAEGQTAEVNLAAEDWVRRASRLFERGSLILVDYGAEAVDLYDSSQRPEGTLRAFREHRFAAEVLASPGKQDLTTTVDWTSIRRAGEESGLQTDSFSRQDEFLLREGLLDRLEKMTIEAESTAEAVILRTVARELILPGGMSQDFQVLIQKRC